MHLRQLTQEERLKLQNEEENFALALYNVTEFMKKRTHEDMKKTSTNNDFRRLCKNLSDAIPYDDHQIVKTLQPIMNGVNLIDPTNYENFKAAAEKMQNTAAQYTQKPQGYFFKTVRKDIKEIKKTNARFIEDALARISMRKSIIKDSLIIKCQEKIEDVNLVIGQMKRSTEPFESEIDALEKQRTSLFSTLDKIHNNDKVRTYSKPGSEIIEFQGRTREEKIEEIKNALGIDSNIALDELSVLKVDNEQLAEAARLEEDEFRLDPADVYIPSNDVNADRNTIAAYKNHVKWDEDKQGPLRFTSRSAVAEVDGTLMAIMKYDDEPKVTSDEYRFERAYKLLLKFHSEMQDKDVGKNLVLSDAVDPLDAQAIFAVCKIAPEKFPKPNYSQDIKHLVNDYYLYRMEEHARKKTTKFNVKGDRNADLSAKEIKERAEAEMTFWQRWGFSN